MARVALLDDYQGVALGMADWKSLPKDTEVVAFRDHLDDDGALAARLADFDIVMAMRERTPFPRTLLERLPRLKLLITAGMRNASIDMKAAAERGVLVCGTAGLPYPTAELAWRWSDSLSWVTKRDAAEPSFAPHEVIASVSPVPLYMIQSTKDEYVSPSDYERFRATAKEPKQLVLIEASNHRFTDKRKELSAAFTQGLAWIARLSAKAP